MSGSLKVDCAFSKYWKPTGDMVSRVEVVGDGLGLSLLIKRAHYVR